MNSRNRLADEEIRHPASYARLLLRRLRIASSFNILKRGVFSACRAILCFHNPLNSDMDYRIFNIAYVVFLHVYIHVGLQDI